MLFSTPFFLFVFLPVFFALYWVIPARRALLLTGSTIFYGWSEPIFLLVVFASTLLDWRLGRAITAPGATDRRRKRLVAAGVVSNLAILVYVKYTAFALGNINLLLASFSSVAVPVPAIALPLGVSFIVFEKITYLVDLYRGVARSAVSLLDYANYVTLFPKLLAGPIVKYHDIASQLARPAPTYVDVREGLVRFIQGLAKKVIIADTLAPTADQVFSLPAITLDSATAWLGLVCFALQIFFDFSGYSDMAIGLGRMMGFRLLENFNHPYLATSFTDFWRRWHISLSSWIKEYLYIPLGGNRAGAARGYANLCVCFLLSGLWHGASWNFVLWGGAHGGALVVERACWLRWQSALPAAFNRALTLLLITLTWVLFRCPEFTHALNFFHALIGRPAPAPNWVVPSNDVWFILFVAAGIVFAPLFGAERFRRPYPAGLEQQSPYPAAVPVEPNPVPSLLFAGFLLFISVGRITVNSFHPFLYFRF